MWNYYRDESNIGFDGVGNNRINYSKAFDYKTSITGKLKGGSVEKEKVEIAVIKIFKQFLESIRNATD